MIYYFLIIILLIEAAILFSKGVSREKVKMYLILVFLKLFVISAFRSSNIGNDTYAYIQLFEKLGLANGFFESGTRYEAGYIALNHLVYLVSSNSQSILIATSFIILFLFISFIYKEMKLEMAWLSVYLFITLRYFYATMNVVRLSLAMGIIFISYKFLKEKKPFLFIITIITASFFHATSIVFIIAYPLSYLKFRLRNILLFAVVGIGGFLFFDSIIMLVFKLLPQYQHYLDSHYFEGNQLANILQFLIDFTVLLFGSYLINRYKKIHKENEVDPSAKNEMYEINILRNLLLIGTVISFIAIKASLLDRVSSYFTVFVLIFIPKVIILIKDKKERVLYIYLVMVFTLLYHTVIFVFRPEWNKVFPYEFFW